MTAPKPEQIQAENIIRGHDKKHVWKDAGAPHMSVFVPKLIVPQIMESFERYCDQHPHNKGGRASIGASSEDETNILVHEDTLGGIRAHLSRGKQL